MTLVPVEVGRSLATRQALGIFPLAVASRAAAAGVKGVPGMAALAEPHVFVARMDVALGTSDALVPFRVRRPLVAIQALGVLELLTAPRTMALGFESVERVTASVAAPTGAVARTSPALGTPNLITWHSS